MSYQGSELLRSAVERQFEIAGEALSQLSKVAPDLAATVPHWREIIAFRNVLIHGYAVIDDARVWQIILVNLPGLANAVDQLLAAPRVDGTEESA